MNGIPRQRDQLTTLTFHPDNFAIIQASASEDVSLAMREERPARMLATHVLAQELPQVACCDTRYVGLLAGMVEQFAERTEDAVVNIAMDVPKEIAEPLIEERRTQGEVAAKLAKMIQAESDWLDIVDTKGLDFDTWVEGLEIEGN